MLDKEEGNIMAKQNKDLIEAQVKGVLSKNLKIDLKEITYDALLAENLGVDSFSSIEIMFELEDKFDIEIPEADIANAKTVRDVVEYVTSRLAEKSNSE